MAGFPDGYTLKEGKWLYEYMHDGNAEVGEMRELACEKDYVKMKKGREGRDVLVWHVGFHCPVDA